VISQTCFLKSAVAGGASEQDAKASEVGGFDTCSSGKVIYGSCGSLIEVDMRV
jgi:hypothetical protein